MKAGNPDNIDVRVKPVIRLSGLATDVQAHNHSFTLNIEQYAASLRRDDHRGIGKVPSRCVIRDSPRYAKSGKYPDPNPNSSISVEGTLAFVDYAAPDTGIRGPWPICYHLEVESVLFHSRPPAAQTTSRASKFSYFLL